MKAERKYFSRKPILCLVLILALILSLWGCGAGNAGDLMAGVKRRAKPKSESQTAENADAAADFGLRLFSACMEQEKGNVMVSPLSVLCALSMTANGAKGETLAQMEKAFGLPQNELREYLAAYVDSLPSGEGTSFHAANSLWLKDQGLRVEKSFLQDNADYFNAGAYSVPMDNETLREINDWVRENTHKMIPQILDELDPATMAVLVNALAFEGEWDEPYEEAQLREGEFIREDGTAQAVRMMYSGEYRYLEDEAATGFLKYYKGGDYAFAALLPEEGLSVKEYADSLTGEKLRKLLNDSRETAVNVGIPKFESDFSTSLNEVLTEMGMLDAFDGDAADFSGLGTAAMGNLYIDKVLHKTYIAVDEQGTKAAAVTAVVMEAGGAIEEEIKSVILDRPFLYAIIDCQTGTPLFLGALTDLSEQK